MSVTVTKNQNARNFGGHPGVHVVTAALSSETYTNGSGVNIDISSAALLGNWDDISAILGSSNGGHSLYVTKNSTDWSLNVRMWNGTTEESTAAKTATFILVLFQNYEQF